MSDIVDRLRSYRPYRIGDGEWFGPKVCEEAAETILSLRKEAETLKQALAVWVDPNVPAALATEAE